MTLISQLSSKSSVKDCSNRSFMNIIVDGILDSQIPSLSMAEFSLGNRREDISIPTTSGQNVPPFKDTYYNTAILLCKFIDLL